MILVDTVNLSAATVSLPFTNYFIIAARQYDSAYRQTRQYKNLFCNLSTKILPNEDVT